MEAAVRSDLEETGPHRIVHRPSPQHQGEAAVQLAAVGEEDLASDRLLRRRRSDEQRPPLPGEEWLFVFAFEVQRAAPGPPAESTAGEQRQHQQPFLIRHAAGADPLPPRFVVVPAQRAAHRQRRSPVGEQPDLHAGQRRAVETDRLDRHLRHVRLQLQDPRRLAEATEIQVAEVDAQTARGLDLEPDVGAGHRRRRRPRQLAGAAGVGGDLAAPIGPRAAADRGDAVLLVGQRLGLDRLRPEDAAVARRLLAAHKDLDRGARGRGQPHLARGVAGADREYHPRPVLRRLHQDHRRPLRQRRPPVQSAALAGQLQSDRHAVAILLGSARPVPEAGVGQGLARDGVDGVQPDQLGVDQDLELQLRRRLAGDEVQIHEPAAVRQAPGPGVDAELSRAAGVQREPAVVAAAGELVQLEGAPGEKADGCARHWGAAALLDHPHQHRQAGVEPEVDDGRRGGRGDLGRRRAGVAGQQDLRTVPVAVLAACSRPGQAVAAGVVGADRALEGIALDPDLGARRRGAVGQRDRAGPAVVGVAAAGVRALGGERDPRGALGGRRRRCRGGDGRAFGGLRGAGGVGTGRILARPALGGIAAAPG